MAKRTAVIDIGSNSIRVVIYEKTSRFAFHIINEEKSRVRIGENSYLNDSNLTQKAMDIAYDTLSEFKSICTSFKVQKILCVATSAMRDAPNKNLFISRVKKELNINIKVISGDKEAYYGALSCASLLPIDNSVTIDIGGGSTEFAFIENKTIVKTYSFNLGTVRLKELFFDKKDIRGAIKYIDKELSILSANQDISLIGIGGTFRAITNAILKSSSYPLDKIHGYNLTSKQILKYINDILHADEDKLKTFDIKKERYDVIKPGALILKRAIKLFSTKNLVCSGVGVREGVYLADLLRTSNHKFPANYNPSLRYLLDKHSVDTKITNSIAAISKKIFELVYKDLNIPYEYLTDLTTAAKLSKIGESLHFYSYHQHSYYLIQSALEYGYTHKQITLISTLVRFQKKRLPSIEHFEQYKELLPDIETLNVLSYILSISDILRVNRDRNFSFKIEFIDKTIKIYSKSRLHLAREKSDSLKSPKGISLEFIQEL